MADPAPSRSGADLRLRVAAWIVAAEFALESAHVIGRDQFGPGGRALLVLALGTKVVFAVLAVRRSAAGVLGLLVFEAMGLLVALGADWSMSIRLALVATVAVVTTLVVTSLESFPAPELPRP